MKLLSVCFLPVLLLTIWTPFISKKNTSPIKTILQENGTATNGLYQFLSWRSKRKIRC